VRWSVLLALVLAACNPLSATQVAGEGVRVRLEWSPPQPRALRPVALRLRIQDPAGRSVPLSALRVRARMPEMSHRAEELPFRPTAAGRYEATYTFSMDGRWELRIDGTTAAGERVKASFTLDVGP
jgi:nitrogen fixation protein FixH